MICLDIIKVVLVEGQKVTVNFSHNICCSISFEYNFYFTKIATSYVSLLWYLEFGSDEINSALADEVDIGRDVLIALNHVHFLFIERK